jgi:hypothetical protein
MPPCAVCQSPPGPSNTRPLTRLAPGKLLHSCAQSCEKLPCYLATRIDKATGPVTISNSAKEARTVKDLLEQGGFFQKKTGIITLCLCFEEVTEETISPLSTPLPTRIKNKKAAIIQEDYKLRTPKAIRTTKVKKEKATKKEKQPIKEEKAIIRKRTISQLSDPQTEKTPPVLSPAPSSPLPELSYDVGFSDIILPEEEELISTAYDTSNAPYNLRRKR